ncbi:hypothetical protein G6F36_012322 [Rhizopus arrhizus]|nr:hypothetical protein G6F36_012322 [Rhizopus arrhizus]
MLVHLRSTNSLPNEKRETRPDAAISEKPHLEFTSSIGFGEAKVKQRSSARYSLCIDNLRLTTFCKNTIDDNKLDGAIAFQIHGKEVKKKAGIICGKLAFLLHLVNVKKLLAINNVFGRYCQEFVQPKKIEARYAKILTTLNDLIDGKQGSSRSCVLNYGQ